jgi:hypothetical protein
MNLHRWSFLVAVGLATLSLVGCGSDSPTSPSGAKAVLHGIAIRTDASGQAHGRDLQSLSDSGGKITVRIQEKVAVSTTISVNGTFELEDLPTGTFHLEFVSSSGTVVGTVTVTGVNATSEVDLQVEIKVDVQVTTVVVIKIEVDGVVEHDGNDKNDDDQGENN